MAAANSVIEKLVNLLMTVIHRIKRDTRFLIIIMLFFILAGTAIFILIYLSYLNVLDAGLHGTLMGIGISMFTTSVISYIFQIRKNNIRITTLNNMTDQIKSVEETQDEESVKTVNEIYKTVFGKLITDNLN